MSDTGQFASSSGHTRLLRFGPTPVQPPILGDVEVVRQEALDRTIEVAESAWAPITVSEQPRARTSIPGDSSMVRKRVSRLGIRSPQGWPIAMVLSEVGAVALKSWDADSSASSLPSNACSVSFADPFPWQEV